MHLEEARLALQAYGFIQEGNMWFSRGKRDRTQCWQETENGFFRHDPDNLSRTPIPYKIKPEFEGTGGLDFNLAAHKNCFDWVWPYEEIVKTYKAGWESARKHNEEHTLQRIAATGQPPVNNDVIDYSPEPPAPSRSWFRR